MAILEENIKLKEEKKLLHEEKKLLKKENSYLKQKNTKKDKKTESKNIIIKEHLKELDAIKCDLREVRKKLQKSLNNVHLYSLFCLLMPYNLESF